VTGADSPGLDQAYRAHAPAVFRRARRILGSAHEAEEIVQELFEALAVDPDSLARTASLTGWFYTTTTNRCINRIRDKNNRIRLLRENMEPIGPQGSSVEDAIVLRQLLSGLPGDLANVAVYYYGDEMTHDEIAKLLGCSRRHVGNLLARLHEMVNASEGQS